MQTAESSADACPLDERQQRRILDGVLAGPVVELLREVVRRLPDRPRKAADEADYQQAVERRLHPMRVNIALNDQTGPFGHKWPGTALTVDDLRRLATMENTTQLRTTKLLHHCVRVAHHLFQSIIREIMATSTQTGVSVRELLQHTITGNGLVERADNRNSQVDAACRAGIATTAAASPEVVTSDVTSHRERSTSVSGAPPAVEPELPDSTVPFFPPSLMSKRTAATAPVEGLSEERIAQLEERMRVLQQTMDTLIGAIDEFRDDVVHTLRNLPDRMPPPLHIHSLPLDPTDPDFADRVNAVPPDVMARLRDEAVRGREGETAPAAAAEGNPSPAPMLDETPPDHRRHVARQPRLFA